MDKDGYHGYDRTPLDCGTYTGSHIGKAVRNTITGVTHLTPTRNEVLEEVAAEFDKMKVLGDTAASFAAFVRAMKR